MIYAGALSLTIFAMSAPSATAAEILMHDAKSQPESLLVAADGTLFAGSASAPYIYRVKKGSTTAGVFVDASKDGTGRFSSASLPTESMRPYGPVN